MTVPVQVIFNAYTANGATTVFPYGFKITAAEDLQVSVAGVVVTTGFTVSGVGVNGGGNVTFSVAPLNGQKVLLELKPIAKRITDYQQFGDWNYNIVNNDFDRLWLAMQNAFHDITLSARLPTDSTANPSLPTPTANNLIAWNSAANGMENRNPNSILAVGTADVHAATSKVTPVDADELPLIDSAAAWGLKNLTWANLKGALSALTSTWAISTTGNATTATTATTATNLSGGTVSGGVTGALLSKSATDGIGYATGAGGVVTQLTSKATAVTLHKRTGYITLHNAALAGGAEVSFMLTNSALVGGDFMIFQQNNFAQGTYAIRAIVSTGSAVLTLKNITAGSLSEALEFQFITFRAVNS